MTNHIHTATIDPKILLLQNVIIVLHDSLHSQQNERSLHIDIPSLHNRSPQDRLQIAAFGCTNESLHASARDHRANSPRTPFHRTNHNHQRLL